MQGVWNQNCGAFLHNNKSCLHLWNRINLKNWRYYSLSLVLVRKALDWGHVGLLRHAQVVEGVQRWAQHLHLDDFLKRRGCILNLKFIFPPPPFWLIIFPRLKFFIMRGWAPQAKNFQTFFFLNFVYFKSIEEKICILFTNWGQTEKYTPQWKSEIYILSTGSIILQRALKRLYFYGDMSTKHPLPKSLPAGFSRKLKVFWYLEAC